MNCLIIAAGHGSRLRKISSSKPLTPVAGAPLIAHVVRAAAHGGASAFTVVTGHEAARVEAFLATLTDFPIRTVRVADWDLPNGHSVLAGAAAIQGDYLLTMADHLFDAEIVRRLIGARPAALTLAVDRDLAGPLLDMDDATKVETDAGGAIVRIGKALERFDAIDTGLFRATPALAAAIERGGGSLSEGVQRLADQGLAATADVTGLDWLDVDDEAALAKAEAWFARR
ncbi:MAG: 1L-myo-inositol 1-phosphate cytidylyltransferase [Sphingomonadales bacterium]|jgi:choline kinase|nr:1L-myo-inositol 1-phosphate cytidylyltransferase [Sphingomonadales bacterium]MEA3043861.1 1L-myo-inositol 1-phosphate cytidylyltransferase [Sphingomonadales bacterium]